MELSLERHVVNDGVIRLAVAGEIDLATCQPLSAAIREAIVSDRVAELIVDLDKVAFLDSSGVRTLVEGMRLAHVEGVTLSVMNARGIVREVLDITGVVAS
jgi:anti-anti-sigma factor